MDRRKFLEKLFIITWDDVMTFDDIPIPEDVQIIKKLEAEELPKCPYLRKVGKSWYFCGVDLPEEIDERPSPVNPVYHRRASVIELQLFCMGEFDGCCYKTGELKY